MKSTLRSMLTLGLTVLLAGAFSACGTLCSKKEEKKDCPAKKDAKACPAKKAPAKKDAKACPAKKAPAKKAAVKKAAPAKKAAVKKVVKPFAVKVAINKKGGVYKVGEKAVFTISFLKDGKPFAGQKMGYFLTKPGAISRELVLFTSTVKPHVVTVPMTKGGVARIEVAAREDSKKIMTFTDSSGKKYRVTAAIGAIAAPETFKAGLAEPADFLTFWKNGKAALAKVPVKALERKKITYRNKRINVWDVKVQCLGDKPVSGYLAIPAGAKKKSLPAIVYFHGAGVYSSSVSPDYKAITFNVNAHGIANGQKRDFYAKLRNAELKNYAHKASNDREKFYFRNMFLRVQRALDYVKTLPEWNGKDLVVYGGSQGGAQALVAGGLDPQVTLLYAAVPAMCDHGGILKGRISGWPRLIRAKGGKATDPNVVKTAAYYDCALFAKYIKAESYLTVGLMDNTCHPTSVYAAFNNIRSKKHITVCPDKAHGGTYSVAFVRRLSQVKGISAKKATVKAKKAPAKKATVKAKKAPAKAAAPAKKATVKK